MIFRVVFIQVFGSAQIQFTSLESTPMISLQSTLESVFVFNSFNICLFLNFGLEKFYLGNLYLVFVANCA